MARLITIVLLLMPIVGFAQGTDVATGMLRVIVFLATDCPISQDYIGKLNRIAADFGPENVVVIGVIPAPATRKSLVEFRSSYQVNFDLVVDKKHKYVRMLRPSVTPEAFLIDENNEVLYSGAIDDWYYDLGKHRPHPTCNYLTDAIVNKRMGYPIDPTTTQPIGCHIDPKSKQ